MTRLGLACVGALSLAGAGSVALYGQPARSAPATVSNGTSTADATTMQIDPRQAELSVGLTIGTADTHYTNDTATASSQGVNLGVIGTTLGAEGCTGGAPTLPLDKQPQPLQVDSRSASSAKGQTANTYGLVDQYAQADPTPSSNAVTTTKPIAIPGVVSIGPGTATATSKFVNGVRTSIATVDLSSIALPGGYTLTGLHWEATYPTGNTSAKPTGTFTMGTATGPLASLGGLVGKLDPAKILSAISAQTDKLLGLEISEPTIHVDNGTLFVDPLKISVVPNKLRDSITNGVLIGLQPLRDQLSAAVLKATCQAATAFTLADIGLGAIAGGGSLNLELGGVQATSGDVSYSDFLGGAGDLLGGGGAVGTGDGGSVSLSDDGGSDLGDGTTGDLGADAGTAPSDTESPASAPAESSTARPAASHHKLSKGARGGALLGIGLLAFAALLGMAEADRRRMLKSAHQIPGGT
ncbi:MAG TPA: hypothetical protein VHA73_01905 [Acidimicrobiales bacterium]|nr:hypothetical protein [Acidimicrobiales bacterium]